MEMSVILRGEDDEGTGVLLSLPGRQPPSSLGLAAFLSAPGPLLHDFCLPAPWLFRWRQRSGAIIHP